jgi:hypothetical protein
VSAKTSAAAIEDLIDILMPGPSFRTPGRPAAYSKERIVRRIGWSCSRNRLQPSRRAAAVRQDETLALGHAAQNTRRISAKVKHRDRLYHVFNFNLKFNTEQGQNEAADWEHLIFCEPRPRQWLTEIPLTPTLSPRRGSSYPRLLKFQWPWQRRLTGDNSPSPSGRGQGWNWEPTCSKPEMHTADSFPPFAQPIPTCSLTNRERDSLANDGQIEPNRRKWPLDD